MPVTTSAEAVVIVQPYILEDLARERQARLLARAALERRRPRPRPRPRQTLGHWLIALGARLTGGEVAWRPRQASSS